MKKIIFLLIAIFILVSNTKAQTERIDSLKQIVITAQQDTNKVKTLNILAKEYQNIDLDSASIYAEQSLELALLINYKPGEAEAYRNIGIIHFYLGDYEKALKYFQQLFNIYTELNNKIKIADGLNLIAIIYSTQSNYPKALEYFLQALKINEELGDKTKVAAVLGNIGLVYATQSNYLKALDYYLQALKINEGLGAKSAISTNLGNIAIVFSDQGDISKAINYFLQAIEINKELGNKIELSQDLNNLGSVYIGLKQYDKAIEYINKSLKINKEFDNKAGIDLNLGNLGLIHFDQKNYSKALDYYLQSLKISEELENKMSIAENSNNIGDLYIKLEQYNKAIEYSNKALKISKEINILDIERISYENLSEIYKELHNYKKALEYKDLWVVMNDSIFNTEKTKSIAEMNTRFETEKKEKQIEQQQIKLKNSQLETAKEKAEKEKQRIVLYLFIFGFISLLIFIALVYRLYKQKRKDNILLEKQRKELQKLKTAIEHSDTTVVITDTQGYIEYVNPIFQKLTGYTTKEAIGLNPSVVNSNFHSDDFFRTLWNTITSGEVWRGEIKNKRKNGELFWESAIISPVKDKFNEITNYVAIKEDITERKKTEKILRESKQRIEGLYKDITDSVNYAKRIQDAILPSEKILAEYFPEYFILYKPKDVVSGDFYYFKKIENYLVIAVADCTGHGVPGAFVSMLGISFLNEIIRKKEVTTASQILEELRTQVKLSLNQVDSETKTNDGMDIALCVIDTKTNELQYAGAYNPLFIIRNSELIQIKATRSPIGCYIKEKVYKNNQIQLQKDDMLYIFSDGYADQFGGMNYKKFNIKQLRSLLLEVHKEEINGQKIILDNTIEKWKGKNEQLDDIAMLGIKI